MLQRYISVVRWILADGLLKYKFRVIAIILTGIASGMLQATAVGQTIYYAKLLEKGEKISLLGYEFDPRTSVILVGVFALVVFVTLISASMTQFFSRRQAIRINGLYEEFCSRRIMGILAKCQLLNPDKGCRFTNEKNVRRISSSDCRLSGRSLRMLLWTITPLVEFAIFIGIMFYIDFFATLAVTFFTVLTMFFLYRINRSAISISRVYEESGPRASAEKLQLLGQLSSITQFNDTQSWIDIPFEQGQIRLNREAYEDRLAVVEQSRFVTRLLTALLICITIIYFGAKSLMLGTSWGLLLAYVIALRRSTKVLIQLSGIITSINRFYPQVKRYHEFITFSGIAAQSNGNRQLHQAKESLQTSADAIAESEDRCLFQGGDVDALLSPVSINRYTLAFIISGLLPKNELTSVLPQVCFVADAYDMPSIGLRGFLSLPEQMSRGELLQEMVRSGLDHETVDELPSDLDKPLSQEQWRGLNADLKCAIALEAILRSDYQWVVLDEKVLRNIPVNVQQYYLNLMKDRIILIVNSKNIDYGNIGCYGEQQVIVLGDHKPKGIGTPEWACLHKEEIEMSLAAIAAEVGITVSEEEEEDIGLLEE